MYPGWFDGLTADPVEEKYISQMSALETRTGVDLEDMPSFPPAMIAELEQIYAGQSKVKYTNEDSAWRASFGILMDAGGWMVEMQRGEPVWVTDQPVSQALTARIGSGVTLKNDDYRKHASDQIRNLGYTKKNGRAILASDIRFVKTNKRQNYIQRGPMGVSANVPHTVTPFTVEYKDGDMWVEVPNFNYVADGQAVINPAVKSALLELRDGGTITEPINYFLTALSKAGIGDMEGVISDKAEKYFQAFREQSHLDLLQDRMNTVRRSFGLEEINYKLDYEDYIDSVVPGDVAARMVWDSWRIMGQTGADLFSALGQSMADAGGKTPTATAKFDMESMQRANPGALDIEAPPNAETVLPNKARISTVLQTTEAKGRDVVEQAVSAVDKIFGGGQFLKEIANVESDFGKNQNTFTRISKGMWQVDPIGFEETQRNTPKLKAAKAKIEKEFGIKWSDVKHNDLNKPLIGALASRLFLISRMK